MFSVIPFFLDDPPYTEEQVYRFLAEQGRHLFDMRMALLPNGELFLEEKPYEPISIPVYTGEADVVKEYALSADQLYRCETAPHCWQSGEGVALNWNQLAADNAWVDVMEITPCNFWWYRYHLTDKMPDMIPPAPFGLLCFRNVGGRLTVTGTRGYCEMLSISNYMEGKKVYQVMLEEQPETRNLHTLVLEEGIEVVDAPWGLPALSRIRLPESVKLLSPPHGIQNSQWYRKQTGAVYLQNYYCGTNGQAVSHTLQLQEGTIGVIDGADRDIFWREIRFPDSVAYLGDHCFAFTPSCPEEATEENCWDLIRPLEEGFTGRDLYRLFRTSPFVKSVILPGWMPTVPRLTYAPETGWAASSWYFSEEKEMAGYCASFLIPSGQILSLEELPGAAPLNRTGIWTDDYETPFEILGREYLEFGAKLAGGGKPEEKLLHRSHLWWGLCQPPQYRRECDLLTTARNGYPENEYGG